MRQSFFVPGPLPGMNDFISTGSRFRYNDAKKRWAVTIGSCIRLAKISPVQRVHITWLWHERNRQRNPDNFAAIGKKFVLDTLQACGILKNDGWKQIAGWSDDWVVDVERPGVLVTLEER